MASANQKTTDHQYRADAGGRRYGLEFFGGAISGVLGTLFCRLFASWFVPAIGLAILFLLARGTLSKWAQCGRTTGKNHNEEQLMLTTSSLELII